ncbi:molybdopterin-synthase adenylyltransferase MoeB [Actinomyces sp. zg328]|uniref:molybdopterin-synthase adenylyltransferase MoeB n=1 Tax=Actinomyces sp. zg328 TaxID=2609287 RepID=UPI0013591E43|nr:molybdopterin-synthase adenylyltransferase MoeB [Actinomyces sp. zg328]
MTPQDRAPWAPIISDGRLRALSDAERARYSRNMLVPEVGVTGQRRIRAARVLLIGAGGLGAPAALYLAAAGVGTLGIVEFDVVDASNLQRQIIHTTAGVGASKARSAASAINALNPDVEVILHEERLDAANALDLLEGWDVVVDGTDNFPTRYLVGDACAMLGIPLVHGAVLHSAGQVGVFDAARGPCHRCLHPEPPPPGSVPSCAEAGVLGVLPGIIGTMQAAEALKLIVGGGEPLIGRLLLLDAWGADVREVPVAKRPGCALCGASPTITSLETAQDACAAPEPAQPNEETMSTITVSELRARIAAGERPGEAYTILDVREADEVAAMPVEGAVHIPLGEVVERAGELDTGKETVVTCQGGTRSKRAIEALQAAGYAGALTNLEGGARAWYESA